MPLAPDPAGTRIREGLRIAGTAWLILFLELGLIRFTSAYVRVFAFYANFVIIAAFLGMGTGMLRHAAAARLRWLFPAAMAAMCVAVGWLAVTPIDARTDALEWLWGAQHADGTGRHVPLVVAVVLLFALATTVFVPLGAALGSAMRRWRPLPAYAADLAGSLTGVATFAAASAWQLPPVAWFSAGFAVWLVLVGSHRRLLIASIAGGVVAIGTTAWLGARHSEQWSPYYRITMDPGALPGSTTINVNGALHQVMLDFSRGDASPEVAKQRAAYERPYQFVGRLDTVLVVGAGTGNDIAILLGLGARWIDAVEIDPVIAGIGRRAHPMHPYDDPRVHLVVTDARAFLRNPPRRYDVITFGTLDSQTLLGGMTSVRLDNYVYTLESFRAARDALAPGGSVVMYHLSGLWFIAARLYQNLEAAFGAPPRVFTGDDWLFTYTFVAGAGAEGQAPAREEWLHMPLRLSTDTWPFPYLRGRRIPAHYLVVLAAVLVIGLVFVAAGGGPGVLRKPDWPLFGIGAGFLLLETKSITTLSLLFGSTWTVNAAVIGAILVVAMAAAMLTDRGRAPGMRMSLLALGAILVASLVVRPADLASTAQGFRWVVAGAYVAIPVFFASVIFSRAYAGRPDPTAALAFNILGAVAGGVLEYASMTFGLDALSWIALAMYAAAVAGLRRGATTTGAAATASRASSFRPAARTMSVPHQPS